MARKPSQILDWLRSQLWFVPALSIAGAIGLSFVTEYIDHRFSVATDLWFVFSAGADGARRVFSSISSSMMSLTGLVFSITILVLQLAGNQFSPRALRTFLRDRLSQATLGIFLGTYVFALMGLRTVRGDSGGQDDGFVPFFTVWVSVALVLLSIAVFVAFIHHIAQSIRVETVVERIAQETRGALMRMYPDGLGEETRDPEEEVPHGPPTLVIPNPDKPGVIAAVDEETLLKAATEAKVVIRLRHQVGDFVPGGAPLFDVWGEVSKLDTRPLAEVVLLSRERSMRQDPAFGFRQLVDIAERALSPGVNDPTTATQALDQLHDLLRRLASRKFPDPCRRVDGALRLVLPRPSWSDYVQLALEEIADYGRGSIQVRRHAERILDDLLETAPPFRRAALLRQRARFSATYDAAAHAGTAARESEEAPAPLH
jgi:uncharacterized membrane protein